MSKNNITINVNGSGDGGKGFQYVRQQKGHSVLLWLVLSAATAGMGLFVMLYYTVSKNHYWHL